MGIAALTGGGGDDKIETPKPAMLPPQAAQQFAAPPCQMGLAGPTAPDCTGCGRSNGPIGSSGASMDHSGLLILAGGALIILPLICCGIFCLLKKEKPRR